MSRKIKIQTVNTDNLENTLKENICTKTNEKELNVPDIPNIIEKTRKIINKFREEDNNPCNDNTGDASAYTNNDISITTNAHNIKRQYLIKKFKEIIFDIATDDFPVDMSMSDRINKKLRQGGFVIKRDFKLFLDIINNEVYNHNNCIPNEITSLITKIHGKNKNLHILLCNQLAGYYNFLINELYIPIEDITENTYFVKLADNYIEIYNKLYFDVPESDLNKLSETAGYNYKAINEKINEINNLQYEIKKYKEYFNSEDSIRHLMEHYNSVDSLIAREKANKDSIKFNKLTGEKIKPINDVTEEFKQAKVIGDAFKTFRDENGVTKYGKLEDVETILKNIPENSTTYEEVNHPDHYNLYDVEVVEMMERIFGIKETMSWCKLNAFKYRMRAGEKPTSTVEKDLKKEKWCLNKYKELKSKK